ncbi:MAG: glutaredoxin family protein [Nitrospinaceae bacterium]|nr:glutaredoxin family protein [Nitrospinaceae bacterium]NIR56277.1 glutaredoxin family protein [Nitrospinaceae bacterium]NIS86734.1 glutaredoxin family protein [Nitrospinaceae bacterium]NIT83566.1 glutaredoxin family protein [Nitrospinaceae bacterium]NIU45771.1 glutaredoxin family protein [Nitrospinaceae bacterium]
MILIEIMTRADCCLCDEAKAVIEQVIPGFPAHIKTTDIESDPELFERYKEKIPVVLINGEESFIHKVHPITLRKKLERLLNR